MSRTQKILWTTAGTLAVLLFGSLLLFAAPVASGMVDPGITRVRVHDKQEDFHLDLPLPDALVSAGLTVASAAGAFDEMEPLPQEARVWMPALRAAAEALAQAPDATLVEVEGPAEHVRVSKRGSRLLVEVRSPDADVDVAVPARLVSRVLELLETSGRG